MRVMMRVETLMMCEGLTRKAAIAIVLPEEGVARATYFDWLKLVRGKLRSDWLPALAPRWKSVTAGVSLALCSFEAWEFLKADYLRLEKPSFASCYDRLVRAAAEHGWTIPSRKTLQRRILQEIPASSRLYLQEGEKALYHSFAAQTRTRAQMHALQGVNADGHTLDVWVRWPDGEVSRPVLIAIQDLYSGKILAWRIDRSENAVAIRLAFYDLFRFWGIPDFVTLDNGRAFASKLVTGGQPSRFRFKVKPGELDGFLTTFGVAVQWTKPYSGQSKPIERAFRDIADRVSRHPRLAGGYAGNCPDAKPDYKRGVTPVDFDALLLTLDDEIATGNARPGRQSEVAAGRSYDEVFGESYEASPIRKATAEQLRMAMLAQERVTARKPSGMLHLLGNGYWSEFMSDHVGEQVTLRYDPDELHTSVAVFGADGRYLGDAGLWHAGEYRSEEAAETQAKRRQQYIRHTKAAAQAAVTLSNEELLALQARPLGPAPAPEARVVRMQRRRGSALQKPQDDPLSAAGSMGQAEVLRLLNVALDQRDEAV